ncbi:MAG: nuclear transport factor 2 family protein [Egibacteraceae bacterium]
MGDKTRRFVEAMVAFNRDDVETFGDILLADDVVWHWGGDSSVSGDYHGRAATLALLKGFRELASHQLQVEPLDVLEGGDFVMSFTHVTGSKGTGTDIDVFLADAMRFGQDGTVVEYWTLANDQRAVDAFIG